MNFDYTLFVFNITLHKIINRKLKNIKIYFSINFDVEKKYIPAIYLKQLFIFNIFYQRTQWKIANFA